MNITDVNGKGSFCAVLAFLLVAGIASALPSSNFDRDLNQLNNLRQGAKTDFDAVEKRGHELLAKYTRPEEQGKIYAMLVHVYAQSGLQHPQRAIEHAQKALALPISRDERMTMFVYTGDLYTGGQWGDHKTFPERRRKALASYLAGLNEVLTYDLPKEKPRYEPFPPKDNRDKSPQGRARQAEAVRAWKKSQEDYKLIFQREVLTRQVATPYLVAPYGTDELRAELARSLNHPQLAAEILQVVEARGPKRPAVLPNIAREAPVNRWRFWTILLATLVVVLAAATLFMRRRSNQPRTT